MWGLTARGCQQPKEKHAHFKFLLLHISESAQRRAELTLDTFLFDQLTLCFGLGQCILLIIYVADVLPFLQQRRLFSSFAGCFLMVAMASERQWERLPSVRSSGPDLCLTPALGWLHTFNVSFGRCEGDPKPNTAFWRVYYFLGPQKTVTEY